MAALGKTDMEVEWVKALVIGYTNVAHPHTGISLSLEKEKSPDISYDVDGP